MICFNVTGHHMFQQRALGVVFLADANALKHIFFISFSLYSTKKKCVCECVFMS
jgi:hypothetical protein